MNAPKIFPYQDGKTSTSISRVQQMNRDNDTVKVPKVTLYDIDYGIYFHLQNNWKPMVIENDISIPVPVMFASGEKWAQIRANGYLRDKDKKVQSPAIILKRNSVEPDTRISLFTGQVWGGNSVPFPSTRLVPYKNTGMQYDTVAGQYLTKESIEYYLIDLPEYIRLTYDLIVWTDLQEQMNVLVQGLIPMSNHMWGDFWKFRTQIQSISHETVNVPGEDRIVKTTMTLYVDGYLRNEYEYQQSKVQKAFSVKKVRFLEEGTDKIIYDGLEDQSVPERESNTANLLQNNLKRRL